MKYTKLNLKKLEALFSDLGYELRYEKGHFQSGYCLLENKKVAVINRFFDTEGRMNSLLEILASLPIDEGALGSVAAKTYKKALALLNEENENP
jgi:hypothetical protein